MNEAKNTTVKEETNDNYDSTEETRRVKERIKNQDTNKNTAHAAKQ